VDVRGDDELDEALHAARVRLNQRGRVVVEGAGCACFAAIHDHATAAGLDVVSFDHVANRVVLAIQPRLALVV